MTSGGPGEQRVAELGDAGVLEELEALRARVAALEAVIYEGDASESERLRHVLAITDVALARLSTDPLLDELLRRIRDILRVDTAAILMLDASGQELVARAAKGLEEEVVVGVRIPVGRGFAGRIASERRPIVIEDTKHADIVNPILREKGLTSLLGVPLLVHGNLLGVLHVGSVRPRRFTIDDERLLQMVADRAALAIDHARLFEQEHQAREEAERALAVREEFLSVAAHELRTPLTSIKIVAQMLVRQLNQEDGDPGRMRSGANQLQDQVRRMERLVNDLLTVSRLQNGVMDLHLETVDLVESARAVLNRCDDMPERIADHRLVLDAREPVIGRWDPTRIEQILTNLVSNALKYSPAGGEVRVRVGRAGDHAELAVSDEGLGMSEEEQATLFQAFRRSRLTRAGVEGTGLGLYIVRQLVDAHGGTIEVDSTPGEGSTFTLRLPLAGRHRQSQDDR